jgi:hypothetical protein
MADDECHEDDYLCVEGRPEHEWANVPKGGSGECPDCGAELVDWEPEDDG